MFFIFRSGPDFQIWVSNLIFTSYFNFSFNLSLSNCWLLVFDFLQDSAVKPRFWSFFSVNYCFFAQFKFRPGIKFSKSRFIWILGLKEAWKWESEFQVYFNKSSIYRAHVNLAIASPTGSDLLKRTHKIYKLPTNLK